MKPDMTMSVDDVIRKMLRGFMISILIVSAYLLAFGILLAICLTGHTLFRRIFLSGCCIVPAIMMSWMAIDAYVRR